MSIEHQAKRRAPCGSWPSPVTSALVAGRTIGLSTLRAEADTLFWLEGRPAEAGRSALRRLEADGGLSELTPPPFDVGSRVHEYGGGAYAARAGRVVFSHRPDGSVWLIEGSSAPRALCAVTGLRFADFWFTPDLGHVLAVREDHREAGGEPRAALVALPLDDGVDPARNEGRVLVQGADFLSSPRTSPGGDRLAWIEWDHPDMPWDATRLHVAGLARQAQHLALSAPRCVAGLDRGEALMQPLFAPDGALHVCSDRSGWWNLYRLSSDALRPVCPMPCEIGQPPWVFGQRSYGFLPDGGIVASVIQEGRAHAMRLDGGKAQALPIGPVAECPVALAEADGGAALGWLSVPADAPAAVMTASMDRLASARTVIAARTVDAGAAALTAADIAVAETVRFPLADGSLGHGFFYAPRNRHWIAPEGERPPLVVMAHGGPTAMANAALSLAVQWWTSRGIAVLDVNYGGSTGFGRAWRQRLDGAWGVVDVDDCVAACAALVGSGRVDPDRLAIRGSSAGGFTVLAALTRSTLFSAAACLYGIGDLRLLAADTHKFESRYLDRLIGELPGCAALYDSRSPIHNLEALRCPVIFFHGLEDKVVPVAQTRLMAEALRARGIAAEAHEFAGEAHGFRREETIRQVLESELAFYGSRFGFTPSAAGTSAPD